MPTHQHCINCQPCSLDVSDTTAVALHRTPFVAYIPGSDPWENTSDTAPAPF